MSHSADTAPHDYQALLANLQALMPSLPLQLQRAARTLEANPDDVALLSMRELAAKSGLSPSTFTRLSRALGFEDYAALREVVVHWIRRRGQPGFSEQARKVMRQPGSRAGFAAHAQALQQAITGNVGQAFTEQNVDAIDRAAQLLAHARRVYLLGSRSCVSLTHFLHYASQLFCDKVASGPAAGGGPADALRFLRKGDVVVAFTFEPYARDIGDALQAAAASDARTVLVTDSTLAPNIDLAAVRVIAPVATPSFFPSLAAPLAAVDALLLAWLQKEGRPALAQIERTDRQLDDAGVYLRTRRARGAA